MKTSSKNLLKAPNIVGVFLTLGIVLLVIGLVVAGSSGSSGGGSRAPSVNRPSVNVTEGINKEPINTEAPALPNEPIEKTYSLTINNIGVSHSGLIDLFCFADGDMDYSSDKCFVVTEYEPSLTMENVKEYVVCEAYQYFSIDKCTFKNCVVEWGELYDDNDDSKYVSCKIYPTDANAIADLYSSDDHLN